MVFFSFSIKFRSLISSSNIKFVLENKNLLHHRVTGMEERLFKKNLFPRSQSSFIKEIQIYIKRNLDYQSKTIYILIKLKNNSSILELYQEPALIIFTGICIIQLFERPNFLLKPP